MNVINMIEHWGRGRDTSTAKPRALLTPRDLQDMLCVSGVVVGAPIECTVRTLNNEMLRVCDHEAKRMEEI
jgi:hypothetical protein